MEPLKRPNSTGSWMNLHVELEQLRGEVAGLREELASVQAELSRLRQSFAGLRATGGSPPPTPVSSEYSRYPASEGSFSVVTPETSGYVPTAAPHLRDSRAPETPIELLASGSGRGTCPSASITWEQRCNIARSIGEWIARCLAGHHRGSSGRDRNPVASRYWIVARDFAGIIYDPPLIFRSFAGAKALCKRGPAAGDSVFVGVPTEKEVEVVVRSAGLTWSGVFQP